MHEGLDAGLLAQAQEPDSAARLLTAKLLSKGFSRTRFTRQTERLGVVVLEHSRYRLVAKGVGDDTNRS